jgi:hypothetical protein
MNKEYRQSKKKESVMKIQYKHVILGKARIHGGTMNLMDSDFRRNDMQKQEGLTNLHIGNKQA